MEGHTSVRKTVAIVTLCFGIVAAFGCAVTIHNSLTGGWLFWPSSRDLEEADRLLRMMETAKRSLEDAGMRLATRTGHKPPQPPEAKEVAEPLGEERADHEMRRLYARLIRGSAVELGGAGLLVLAGCCLLSHRRWATKAAEVALLAEVPIFVAARVVSGAVPPEWLSIARAALGAGNSGPTAQRVLVVICAALLHVVYPVGAIWVLRAHGSPAHDGPVRPRSP